MLEVTHVMQRDVMELFAQKRDLFAREWARHDGLKMLPADKDGYAQCAGVVDGARCTEPGSLRCTECWANKLWCADCICASHAEQPLHIIEVYASSDLVVPLLNS